MTIGKLPLFSRCSTSFLLLTLGLCAAAPLAQAQDLADQQLEHPSSSDVDGKGADEGKSPWNVTLGLGVGVKPRYQGSDREKITPMPFGSISYDKLATLGPDGLRVSLLHSNSFRAGVLVGYNGGRDASTDSHLNGLGNIAPTLQAGGFATYEIQNFEVRAQAEQAVTHSGNGLQGTLGLSYRLHPTNDWLIKVGPQVTIADHDYLQTYFGVTAAQAKSSGLRSDSIGTGVKDAGLALSSTYQLTDHWLVFGILRVSEFVGDTANSPIVQSKTQTFGGAGLAYHF